MMSDQDLSSRTDWDVIERRRVYDGLPFVALDVETVRLPDGRFIDDYYQVVLPDFCVAVPILDDSRILTQWQYKHGARCTSLTFPAGQMDPGETPQETMIRELREETGFAPGKTHFLGRYCVNGNQGCAHAHLFAMTECQQTGRPDHNDLEDWEVRFMKPSEIDGAIQDGHLAILPHLAVWYACRAHLDL